ncbi:MAG TPA: pseudouridine synthase [Thermodesulfobacteriota bacterium]|nr:pseudouridine synthase [Thermodesulfobacteriota bacterium]
MGVDRTNSLSHLSLLSWEREINMERIQKIIAKSGIASRREAERMVIQGRVSVNGKIVEELGFKADPSRDHIKVDGKRIASFEPHIVLLLNKPRGYLSTVKDPQGRPTIMDFVKNVKWRVYPVGRLDFDAEGLLLLTNDGNLAYLLSHPSFSIPKTYLVKIAGVPEEKKLDRLRRGVKLEDGEAKAVSCSLISHREKNSWVRVVVTEGRNHLVKRMFSAIGHTVLKLKRIEYGPIRLGDVPFGQFRHLTPEEIEKVRKVSSDRGFRGKINEKETRRRGDEMVLRKREPRL